MNNDQSPPDFLRQLETSLAVDRLTALVTLADWLRSYEPRERRPIEFLSDRSAPSH